MAKRSNNKEKKVIQVWSQNVSNLDQTDLSARWGLGDLLRGTKNLHGICIEKNIPFDINFNKHPIGEVLIESPNSYYFDDENELCFYSYKTRLALDEYITKSILETDIINLVTNGFGFWDQNNIEDFRKFIKPRLRFKKQYEDKAIKILPKHKTYNVIHIRLGDKKLFGISKGIPNQIKRILKKKDPKNTYLITDSIELKEFAIEKYQLQALSIIPTHTGVNNDPEDIFGTLLEFMLMGSANKIETFSVYKWISGFAHAASIIYDVPLIDIKKSTLSGKIRSIRKKFKKVRYYA